MLMIMDNRSILWCWYEEEFAKYVDEQSFLLDLGQEQS